MKAQGLILLLLMAMLPWITLAADNSLTVVPSTGNAQHAISAVDASTPVNYVLTSQQILLLPQESGQYRLVMTGISDRVLWFTPSADHQAGVWTLEHLIEVWQQQHKAGDIAEPIHAIISANTKLDGSGQSALKVVTLHLPEYNRYNDRLTCSATIKVDVNHNSDNTHLYHAVLFIETKHLKPI